MIKVSVILHYCKDKEFSEEHLKAQIAGLSGQTYQDIETLVISCDPKEAAVVFAELDPKVITSKHDLSVDMNKALAQATGEWVLLIDNRDNPVMMKKAAIDGFVLGVERQKDAGLFYTSYELEDAGTVKEIHLLDHHIGRVRDNMDYGKVFFVKKKALEAIGGFDESVKYNQYYDLRLKISKKYKLYRIANRNSGSYYKVVAAGKKADVFDYL